MKNAMTKSTLREIKGSFSRWIAILAICALGVGFFCGLKICKEDFILTGDTFYAQHNFYDYELMSTLGLEKKDVTKMQALDGIAKARGSYSADALFLLTDKNDEADTETGEKVAKLHTLLSDINTPALEAGKLPDKPNQCVGDARYFSADDIGKKIRITDNNKQDTKDLLAYDTYELVGICESPLYLNFERGSTSLGNGSVATYLYIPEDGWDSEVYTEIYVCLAESGKIYSDAYKKNADAMKTPLEDALETCASSRYDEIVTEANDKLSEAQDKLDDAKQELADAEKELADGEKKIRDGQKELDDNQKKLDASKKELTQSKKDYEAGLADYEKQKVDAYAQLDAQKAQIDAAVGTPYYDQALAQYQEAKLQVDAQLEEASKQLTAAKTKIDAGEDKLNDGYAKLEKGRKELETSKKKLSDGRSKLADGKKKLADAEEEIEDARKKVDDIENPKTYVLGRDTNIGYVCFDNDTSIVDSIAKVFPVFFFLVAALVCMTTMTRMIDEQRTQIGVLKALGYSEGSIMGKYLFYSGSAAGLGCLIGFFGGSILFPYVIWQAYAIMYRMGGICFVFDLRLGLVSLAASMLCSMGTTYLSCRYELMSVPAQLMRPKAPKAGKRILLERITFVWNRLSFLVKVSIRNVLRYKKRFCMMVIGISGCTALLVTGFGVKDSIANIAGQQFGSVQTYGMSLLMQENYSQGEWEELEDYLREEGRGYTRASERSMDLDLADGKTKSVTVVIPEDTARFGDYWDLHTESGEPIPFPKQGEAILTAEFARRQGIKEGDTVSLSDEDGNRLTLRIIGLSENYVYNYLYLTADSWESQNGEAPDCRSVYINTEGVSDEHRLLARLMKLDAVSSVTVNQDTLDRFDSMMSSLDYIVLVIIICAGSLAFIVLYNLTNINITERIREIATIKVLGFYPMETAAYVFRENLFLTAIGGSAGLLLGKLLHWFVMEQINIDMVSFPHTVLPLSYGYSLLLTFLFAFIVNLVMFQKLDKINMAESLKSIE